MKTKIAWTDCVWNPVTGCTKVSAGCKNCYAERIAGRKLPGHSFNDRSFSEVRFHPERLDAPLHWKKPRRIFVNSMSDLFRKERPMPCKPITPQGEILGGFVCSRGPRVKRYCVVCLRDGQKTDAPFLCDYPAKDGKTCDAALCVKHTNRVRVGVDWCPTHEEMK